MDFPQLLSVGVSVSEHQCDHQELSVAAEDAKTQETLFNWGTVFVI